MKPGLGAGKLRGFERLPVLVTMHTNPGSFIYFSSFSALFSFFSLPWDKTLEISFLFLLPESNQLPVVLSPFFGVKNSKHWTSVPTRIREILFQGHLVHQDTS